jgi:cell wall-associated NlpC family hydrolase
MRKDAGAVIAERALSQIGTPFRLHGRTPGVALDCVGLVAYAISANNVAGDYSRKGVKISTILSHLDNRDLKAVNDFSCLRQGDVAVVACSPRQFHLMVRAENGWVHSHAGLRKVVHTPGASPWPIAALRRMIGD